MASWQTFCKNYCQRLTLNSQTTFHSIFPKGRRKNYYSLWPELDGPPAAQPINLTICENPLPGMFLLPRGPKIEKSKSGTGRSRRRSWSRAGARAGAGLAPDLVSPPRWPAAALSRGGGASSRGGRPSSDGAVGGGASALEPAPVD
jgi:hypothetical protein